MFVTISEVGIYQNMLNTNKHIYILSERHMHGAESTDTHKSHVYDVESHGNL